MKKWIVALVVLPATLVAACIQVGNANGAEASSGPTKPAVAEWKLVWSDEFDGTEIDKTKWDFDLGTGFWVNMPNPWGGFWVNGWGNDELQCYTSRPENAYVKDGMLHIRALKQSYEQSSYTSARLKTRQHRDKTPLFTKTYGRFEFRARLPVGRGLWPALWLMPQDEKYGTWAASGEIDVMESKGHEPRKVHGTLHFGSRWPKNIWVARECPLPEGSTIADFHVYALEWEPGEFRWYVDGRQYSSQTFWWSCSKTEEVRKNDDQGKSHVFSLSGVHPAGEANLNPWPAPYDQPFYIIMNVAVGGRFPGNPDASTVFPQEMVVDYVRVYEKVGGYGPIKPRGPGSIPFAKP
jgi:beta-glucanase (GH16 family)